MFKDPEDQQTCSAISACPLCAYPTNLGRRSCDGAGAGFVRSTDLLIDTGDLVMDVAEEAMDRYPPVEWNVIT